MTLIRPCADLRNNYNEISKICHETNEPIYITRNGTNDLVILSDEAYDNIIKLKNKSEEERIEKLVSEHFDKHFISLEEFKADLAYHLEKATKEIKEGKGIPMKEALEELEAKYHFND